MSLEFIHKAGFAYQAVQVKQRKKIQPNFVKSMAQQQKQQVVDPNVNPPPTEQELLEYRVTMERLMSTFHENVQVYGQGAYVKLIHNLKVTVSKLHTDLVEADKWKVMQSIRRYDGQHFK